MSEKEETKREPLRLLVAKETYLHFKDFHDKKSWYSYPSWETLYETDINFWYDLVENVASKYSTN